MAAPGPGGGVLDRPAVLPGYDNKSVRLDYSVVSDQSDLYEWLLLFQAVHGEEETTYVQGYAAQRFLQQAGPCAAGHLSQKIALGPLSHVVSVTVLLQA